MPTILQASLPRSGNHLLLKLLWDAIPEGRISTCEYYTAPDCCKQIPCLRAPTSEMEESLPANERILFVHKTHDFKLSDFPTKSYKTIFQLRDPSDYLVSHLLWELTQGADFSIGSSLAFINEMALYYIRMYLKWSVLYASHLICPPIHYESLLSQTGKAGALRSFMSNVNLLLEEHQLDYALSKSNIHSHSGKTFQSSIIQQASSLLSNPFVLSIAEIQGSAILDHLPTLSRYYSPHSSAGLSTCQSLATAAKNDLIPSLGTFDLSVKSSPCSLELNLDEPRSIQEGTFFGRSPFLRSLGIGHSRPSGSALSGAVILLPFRLSKRTAICRIRVALLSLSQSISENRELWRQSNYQSFLICSDKIVGTFIENENGDELVVDCVLEDPIIPTSECILIAVGFRPTLDIASTCDTPRNFRIASKISITIFPD